MDECRTTPLADNDALRSIAADAKQRLTAALAALDSDVERDS